MAGPRAATRDVCSPSESNVIYTSIVPIKNSHNEKRLTPKAPNAPFMVIRISCTASTSGKGATVVRPLTFVRGVGATDGGADIMIGKGKRGLQSRKREGKWFVFKQREAHISYIPGKLPPHGLHVGKVCSTCTVLYLP